MTQPGDMKENAVDEKASSIGISAEATNAAYSVEAQDPELDTVNANYTEAEYKRVLWKVDLVLLPFMWLCSGTQAADKSSISAQATFGLLRDTNLVGQQFSCRQLPGQTPSREINSVMQCIETDKLQG